MKNFIILLFYYFLVGNTISIAQDNSQYKHKTFNTENDTLNYRLLSPKNFNKNKKYPLVLFMHGAGERGSDNEAQLIHGSNLFLKDENREKYNAFVVFPQCDSKDYWANINYSYKDKGLGFEFKEKPTPMKSMNSVIKLMDSLVKHPNVDSNRVYVTGLSMGGMATFELLYHRPNMFAAAIPICGGANVKLAESYRKGIPTWVLHGADDTVVNPKYSLDMVNAIINIGNSPKFTLYDKTAHNSWNKAFAEPDFLDWLFNKVKQD